METINYLAEIWGLTLIVIPLSALVNNKYIKKLFAEIENDSSMFLWGMISFVIGLAMVLSYNVWTSSWQVIITILGWASLIKGLSLLFIPHTIKYWSNKIKESKYIPTILVVIIFIGLIITYFGFTS